MTTDRRKTDFRPKPALLARMPEISGNAINGLDEAEFRRPDVVYWAPNMDDIAHGDVQRYFYEQSAKEPAFSSAREARVAATAFELPPVAQNPEQHDPADWTAMLDHFVDAGQCEMIGVADMNVDWAFEDQEVSQSKIIMVGVQHDYDEIKKAPEMAAGLEVMEQYKRAAVVSRTIAAWLRGKGWEAEALTGPLTSAVTMIPPALACGFGELGKHGSIINKEFGASFRLSAVLTDAPFAVTPPRTFGVDEFCASCRICEDACPPIAISPEKQTVRGAQKWYVDFDKCITYFNETHGCAICIAECPWSRPGVGINLARKLERRSARLGTGA